jgi:HAD superfamily hydrolase (TIGR01484 family)
MSKHKAIIFDVDGVVINSPAQQEPSERLGAAVRALQGEYFLSAATGRPWSCFDYIAESLGLTDPCVVAAGTQICNSETGKVLWQCNMEPEDVSAVMAVLRKIPNCRIVYNDYTVEQYYAGGQDPTEVTLEGPVHYLNCIYVPAEVAPGIIEKLSGFENLAITLAVSQRDNHKDILITHKSATKEHAVAELLKLVGVERKDAMAVGDGHNDIGLFAAVGRKVAMGNAVPELKEAADEVIGDVADDGFAEFLENQHG